MVIVDDKSKDGLAQFLCMIEFLLGNGKFLIGWNPPVTMGVNADEQFALSDFIQTRLGGFDGTRAEGFHPNDVQAELLQRVMRGFAMFDQVNVGGGEEDFHAFIPVRLLF
jgi:hypothetical protein